MQSVAQHKNIKDEVVGLLVRDQDKSVLRACRKCAYLGWHSSEQGAGVTYMFGRMATVCYSVASYYSSMKPFPISASTGWINLSVLISASTGSL